MADFEQIDNENSLNVEQPESKKKDKKKLIALILSIVLIIGVVGFDYFSSSTESSETFVAMGTVINSKIYGINGKSVQEKIKNKIDETEKDLSWRIADSDIYKINNAGGKPAMISDRTRKIIAECIDVSNMSSGVFDITAGAVTKLWDFGGDNQRLPNDEEIKAQLPYINYKDIVIDDTDGTVCVQKGQSLDLGAVGKGAACDELLIVLNNERVKSAVVSVGGSLIIFGSKTFNIGIANPENSNEAVGTLKLNNTCVSTSGDYEKVFEQDGKKYHHILDPKSGYPAQSDLSSVTVICQSGLISDALSTACYILGYEKSQPLLEKYGAKAVFVFYDKTVKYSADLEKIFEITNDSYRAVQ